MKLGYLFYWCGWGCIVFAGIFIVLGILFSDDISPAMVIGRTVSALLFGWLWMYIGKRKIQSAKLEEFTKAKQQGFAGDSAQFVAMEQLREFQSRECNGCDFEDVVALKAGRKCCIKPEQPDIRHSRSDNCDYCYSRKKGKAA